MKNSKITKSSNSKVVVLSRIIATGLSVIRSLGNAGYDVDLVACVNKEGMSDIAKCSKFVGKSVEVITNKFDDANEKEILSELLKYQNTNFKEIILFPTDDYSASIMEKYREKLKSVYIMPSVKNDTLTHLMYKNIQNGIANEYGLKTPKEWEVSLRNKEIILDDNIIYPCYCKPIASIMGLKTEMARCESPEELLAHLYKIKERVSNRSVLVQEFLNIDEEIDLSGVCLDEKIIIPAVTKKIKIAQYKKGVVIEGQIVDKDTISSVYDSVCQMLRSIHYVGMFHMDLNVVGKDIFFGELNLRSGGPNYIYYYCGVNLPEIFVNHMLGIETKVDDEKIKQLNKTFVYEDVAWEEYLHGLISKAELGHYLSDADYTLLLNDGDPKPGEVFNETMAEEEARMLKREKHYDRIMDLTGWDRDYAIDEIRDARKRLGITIKQYDNYGFGLVPVEKQDNIYNKLVNEERALRNEKQVVVVSRDFVSSLGAVRSLSSEGYKVNLVVNAQNEEAANILATTVYADSVTIAMSNKDRRFKDTDLMEALLSQKEFIEGKSVLIPCDDYTLSVIDRHRRILANYYLIPSIEEGRIYSLMNDETQRNLAKKIGFAVPQQWEIVLEKENPIPEGIVFPCQCHLLDDEFSNQKAVICENVEELRTSLHMFNIKYDSATVIISECVKEETEVFITGYAINGKAYIPATFLGEMPCNALSNTFLLGHLALNDEYESIIEKASKLMQNLGYNGVFEIKFICSDNNTYYSNTSFTFGAVSAACNRCGVDFLGDYVKALIGQVADENTVKPDYTKSVVNENAVWQEYYHRYITNSEKKKILKAGHLYLIKDATDCNPNDYFGKYIKIRSKQNSKSRRRRFFRRSIRKTRAFLSPIMGPIKRIVLGLPQYKASNKYDPNAERPRVIVAGRSYCSNLCMARSLGRAGYDVEILRIFQYKPKLKNIMKILKPDAYSKYVKGYYVCVLGNDTSRIVTRLVELADPNRKKLFIPVDDVVGAEVDENYEILSQYYYLPNVEGKPGKISHLMNKGTQKELAAIAGLPVIKSCIIKTVEGAFEIPETVDYPCFIKPNISKDSFKTRMRRCDSHTELSEALTELSRRKDVEMIVEDYIEIDKEYSILGLSTRDGVMGPGFFVAEEGGQKEHRGVAMIGRMLPANMQRELIDNILNFIKTLNYEGLFDIDLIGSTNGKMYFVEMNMRFGGSGFAVTQSGINLPGLYADYVTLHRPIDYSMEIKDTNKSFVNEKILIDEFVKGRITKDKLYSSIEMADIPFIKCDDDKKPFRQYKHFIPAASVLRSVALRREAKENEAAGQ